MGDEKIPTTVVTLRTDRDRYAPGAPITATIAIRNGGPGPLVRVYPNSQRYDLHVADADGREVWRWGADRMFAQVMGEEEIAPGATREWRETFPAPAGPGAYVVTAVLPGADLARPSCRIEVRA